MDVPSPDNAASFQAPSMSIYQTKPMNFVGIILLTRKLSPPQNPAYTPLWGLIVVRRQMPPTPHIEVELRQAADSGELPVSPATSFPVIISTVRGSFSCAQTTPLKMQDGCWSGGLRFLAPESAAEHFKAGSEFTYVIPPHHHGFGKVIRVVDV